MAEYIERESTYDDMLYEMCGTGYQSMALRVIKYAPAADVAPVKYARNLATHFDETICTNCGVHLGEVLRIIREDNGNDAVYYYQPKYCANCGAKFDGDVSNESDN